MPKAVVKSIVIDASEENSLGKGYCTIQIEGISIKGINEVRIGNSVDGGTLKLLLEALVYDVEYIEILPNNNTRQGGQV